MPKICNVHNCFNTATQSIMYLANFEIVNECSFCTEWLKQHYTDPGKHFIIKPIVNTPSELKGNTSDIGDFNE